MQVEIPITDEFSTLTGEWTNYNVIPTGQQGQIRNQKHVDIRCFDNTDLGAPVSMLSLDTLTMAQLDQIKMSAISIDVAGKVVVRPGEEWTAGTTGKQSDRNNWTGISLTCTTGNTSTTQSVVM